MRKLILAFSSLLLSASTANVANESDYPAQAVLAEFAKACSDSEAAETAKTQVIAAGWEELPEESNSKISILVREIKELALQFDELEPVYDFEYRKEIGGRTLFLVIIGTKDNGVTSYGCRMYDFIASKALDKSMLYEWAGREPINKSTFITGASEFFWNPGLTSYHKEMSVIYVPQNSPEAAELNFPISGLIFTARAKELAK